MREVFVFVLGKTPQVVTETLYSLMTRRPPLIPDEIHILTTLQGELYLREGLLGGGHLRRVFTDLGYDPLPTDRLHIHVFRDPKGAPLPDIRTAADNEQVGDFITAFIQRLTQDPEVRLHCSLAGGRKTMGFYLGMALSLFSRPQDRLYHVLVPEQYESRPDFYYPSADEGDVVELAELPFVRLKEKVSLGGKSFRELIEEGQKAVDLASFQKRLLLDMKEGKLLIGNREVALPPVRLALYRLLLLQKTRNCTRPERPYCGDCTQCFLPLAELSGPRPYEEMLEALVAFYGPRSGQVEAFRSRWQKVGGMSQDVILQYISKINRTLEGFGPFYTISAVGKPRQRRYGVRVDRSLVELRPP